MTSRKDDRDEATAAPRITRRRMLAGVGVVAVAGAAAAWASGLLDPSRAEATGVMVYKSPLCGCCGQWVEYLRNNGFDVTVRNVEDMDPIKARFGISPDLESCHTAVIEDYVVEGHVPAADIRRLLAERPDARGLSAPGMPVSGPGMEIMPNDGREPYTVFLFDKNGGRKVYARH